MQMSEVDILLDQALNAKSISEDIEYVDIDPDKRVIDAKGLLLGVQSDEKSERIYFKIPKYVGDRLDLMNTQYKLFINYENAEGVRDVYWITDRATDGEYVTFSWLLSRLVTNVRGTVQFSLCVKRVHTDGTITNEWNTTIAIGEVLDGLEASEVVAEYCSDVITLLVTKVDQLEIDVDNLETAVDNLEDKVDKNDIHNRNLLREEWLDTFDGLQNNQFGRNYIFLDKMNYVLDGSVIYSRDRHATHKVGFYINNLSGMARSTSYIVSFKARRRIGSPPITNLQILRGVNHASTSWYLDNVLVGGFGSMLRANTDVSPTQYLMDDFEWHDFRLEFITSSRPTLSNLSGLRNQPNGDVFSFNSYNAPDPCEVEIAELQWKKADNYTLTWSRPIEDASSMDLKLMCNSNECGNLLENKWLSTEPVSGAKSDVNYIDKTSYPINRSFTYYLKSSNSDKPFGFRCTHIDALAPSTQYLIHFKMRMVNGPVLDMRIHKNFNHENLKWYVDGEEIIGFSKNIENVMSDNAYHDVLIVFTTSKKIEMTNMVYEAVSDTISFNNESNEWCSLNIIDFMWIDDNYNEDAYKMLLYNRYLFENRNLLRDEWLTGYELEV